MRWWWAFFLSGCFAPSKPVTLYMPPIPEAGAGTSPVVVGVQPLRVDSAYDSVQITFREGGSKLQRLSHAEWPGDPGLVFATLAARRLGSHFATVHPPDAPSSADVVVGGVIRVLEADYRGSDVDVRLAVDFEVRGVGHPEPRAVQVDVTASGSSLDKAVSRLGEAWAGAVDTLVPEVTALAPAPDPAAAAEVSSPAR